MRVSALLRKIIATVSLAAIAAVCIAIWAWKDYQCALQTPLIVGRSVTVEIIKGDSFNTITDKLIAQHLAIKPFWFKLVAYQSKAFKKLKAGEYELTPGLTMQGILALFVLGKTKQYAITFPEGWSFKQIMQEIEKNTHLEHTLSVSDTEQLMSKMGAAIKHPEGEFFPDTYFFEKHTTDVALLKRAYLKMQKLVEQEWHHKAESLPFKNPYEALILASIVEKETGVPSERPMIAGVFIRRLQQGMLLQTDPTIIYGMGDQYCGDITYKDLKTATPYNTYLNKGLPPTPIAMPGRDAIVAVLHPDTAENLYFVARGDGTHVFSATLKDHNQAVDKFQRKGK